MSELLRLAERCEQATGDSFDLNHAIARAIGCASEPFTASIDAALTLVPEGWFVRLDDLGADGMPLAMLYAPDRPNCMGVARDLKLALCAAALRARAAMDQPE